MNVDEIAVEPGTPTQVANPARTAVRTTVQWLVPFLVLAVPAANSALGVLNDWLREQDDASVPGWVWLAVNGGLFVTGALITLATRIMAIPSVNAFIERYVPWLAPIRQV